MQRNRNIPPKRNIDGIIGGPRRNDSLQSQKKRSSRRQVNSDDLLVRRPEHDDEILRRPRSRNEDVGEDKKLSRRAKRKQQKQLAAANAPKQKGKTKRIVKRVFLIIIIMVLLAAGYFGFKSFSKLKNVFRGGGSSITLCSEVAPEKLKTEGDGRVNVLLLGIGGEKQPDGPNLTDSIMIMSINPLNNDVALLSLPRDLWVSMGDDEYAKVNEAYQNGLYEYKDANKNGDEWLAIQQGFKNADQIIGDALGIKINFNVLISFAAFEQGIDAVGGIDINVPEDLVDYSMAWENNGNPVLASAGEQHMDSKQALMYTRSRYGSDRGDYDRAERQRAVIVALQKKVLSAGTLTNPVKVSQLIDALGDNIRTDIGGEDRTCLVNIARKVDGAKVKSVDLYDLVAGDMIGGQSVQAPKAGLRDYSEIQSYVRNELRDGYIAREDATISVYNASGVQGLATKVADELKSYGYRIDVVETATEEFSQTQIVDTTNEDSPKYTLHYLQRRLGGQQTTQLPGTIEQGNAKIVIILGRDAASN